MTKIEPKTKRQPFKKKEGATPVDAHVGHQLRMRRSLLGLTQEAIAAATGLTFQQIQKYEQGKNRISASRLLQLSKLLNVDPNFFFEPLMADHKEGLARATLSEDQEPFCPPERMNDRETIKLLRTYYSIQDEKIRKNVLKIIKQMAENTQK